MVPPSSGLMSHIKYHLHFFSFCVKQFTFLTDNFKPTFTPFRQRGKYLPLNKFCRVLLLLFVSQAAGGCWSVGLRFVSELIELFGYFLVFRTAGQKNSKLIQNPQFYLHVQNTLPPPLHTQFRSVHRGTPRLVKIHFNSLNTKRRLLYLKSQFIPRSKHFSSRL